MTFLEFLAKYTDIDAGRSDAYGDWLGYQVDSVDERNKRINCSLLIQSKHLSPSGALHGGVVSGYCDAVSGCLALYCLDKEELCATVDLNVKYFCPLYKDDCLNAHIQLSYRGKRLITTLAELTINRNKQRKMAALATATFNIYPKHKSSQQLSVG